MSLVIVVFGWLCGWWLLWSVPLLWRRAGETPVQRPRLSVIVPARDEAASLPHLLRSLRSELRAGDELIVVDDRSTDATAQLAAAAGASVIAAPALPPGWTGKSWACDNGVRAAEGELLVFLDADVRLRAGALDAVAGLHAEHGGLVSVQPFHETEHAYERLSALFNVVSFMGVGAASPQRRGRADGAFGPCLVCAPADYARVGGHAAVRGEVVEDLALARSFDEAGLPVTVRGGGELIRFRMYPGGLRQLVEGWTKNLAVGAGTVPVVRSAGVAAWITALLVTVQWQIEHLAGGGPGAVTVVAAYLAVVLQLRTFFARLGDFGLRWAVAYPLLLGVFVAVFIRSLYATSVRRSVMWRGRSIPVRGRVALARRGPEQRG